MNNNTNIFGCFASGPSIRYDEGQVAKDIADIKGEEFRSYIWGKKGICDSLKKLNHKDYGKDLVLILFQFNISPFQFELENLKEIEDYRKREKSIGIPIIINDDNFFKLSEKNRYIFLVMTILDKLDLLAAVVRKKKLDTKIELLKSDLKKLSLFPDNIIR